MEVINLEILLYLKYKRNILVTMPLIFLPRVTYLTYPVRSPAARGQSDVCDPLCSPEDVSTCLLLRMWCICIINDHTDIQQYWKGLAACRGKQTSNCNRTPLKCIWDSGTDHIKSPSLTLTSHMPHTETIQACFLIFISQPSEIQSSNQLHVYANYC